MSGGSRLLVDVGSTMIKLCTREPGGRWGPVERVPRLAGMAPGEQVRELMARRSFTSLRVCSSANAGPRVGIVALSGRYSAAAAQRAVTEGGGHVAYTRLLTTAVPAPPPRVDILVLAGGVDGGDLRHTRAALGGFDPARHPHDTMIWAGADDPGLLDGLRVDRRTPNVLDRRLRPAPCGLADAVRNLHVRDLVGRQALSALTDVAEGPILPTPAAVGRAAGQLAAPGPGPLVLLDVGGTTTDVFVRAAQRPCGAPVIRHIFTDLGVSTSAPVMVQRLSTGDELLDLVTAVAPDNSRSLFHRVGTGSPEALNASERFLICVYLALRRVIAEKPSGAALRAAPGVLVTGGAWSGTPAAAVRRVVGAACELVTPEVDVLFDEDYLVWAHGLADGPDPSYRSGR